MFPASTVILVKNGRQQYALNVRDEPGFSWMRRVPKISVGFAFWQDHSLGGEVVEVTVVTSEFFGWFLKFKRFLVLFLLADFVPVGESMKCLGSWAFNNTFACRFAWKVQCYCIFHGGILDNMVGWLIMKLV